MHVLITLLTSLNVSASHFFVCDIEATVKEVKNISRLNETSVFSSDASIAKHDQIMVIKIDKSVCGRGGNKAAGGEVTLMIPQKHQQDYKVGDKIKLGYKNVGDARASGISWFAQP